MDFSPQPKYKVVTEIEKLYLSLFLNVFYVDIREQGTIVLILHSSILRAAGDLLPLSSPNNSAV